MNVNVCVSVCVADFVVIDFGKPVVCGEGDYLLIPLVKLVERDQYGFEHQTKPCQIKIAELGNDAGIIGAAVLGI